MPSPLGEGGTSVSETNRVTDEGSYNDGSYGFERLLTTACGRAFHPGGGALIEHVCHLERSREIPRNRNDNNRTRSLKILARRGSLPRPWRLAARADSAPHGINEKRLPFAAEVCLYNMFVCTYAHIFTVPAAPGCMTPVAQIS